MTKGLRDKGALNKRHPERTDGFLYLFTQFHFRKYALLSLRTMTDPDRWRLRAQKKQIHTKTSGFRPIV